MRILVTGANGYIGKALCATLLENGYVVRGAFRSPDRFSAHRDRMECVSVGEIGPSTDWGEALSGVDKIVHLAARVHIMHDRALSPLEEYRKVNRDGTLRLAEAAIRAGVSRLVYLSTVKVHGEKTDRRPFIESQSPDPQDPYALSKWESEKVLKEIAGNTGFEVILRPPLVYGPGVGANFLRLLRFVDRGLPIPLGRVKNQRSMVYLGNVIDAIGTCLNHPKAGGETFLVSDGQDRSTPDIIRIIASSLAKRPKLWSWPPICLRTIGAISGRKDEIDRLMDSLMVDSGKIRKTLGWKPPFTAEEGVRETANWFKTL
jgi:nucleoside-diphosphate-sugar epimerase